MFFGRMGAGFGRMGALGTGGGPTPPAGFVFLIDYDGAYLIDEDGAYLLEAV